jgi:hypothetical protein
MYNLTERNEKRARVHAFLFAIGLHAGLVMLLYTQMDSRTSPDTTKPVKVNVSKEIPKPSAIKVNHP